VRGKIVEELDNPEIAMILMDIFVVVLTIILLLV
jgi:hypothetical protein